MRDQILARRKGSASSSSLVPRAATLSAPGAALAPATSVAIMPTAVGMSTPTAAVAPLPGAWFRANLEARSRGVARGEMAAKQRHIGDAVDDMSQHQEADRDEGEVFSRPHPSGGPSEQGERRVFSRSAPLTNPSAIFSTEARRAAAPAALSKVKADATTPDSMVAADAQTANAAAAKLLDVGGCSRGHGSPRTPRHRVI